MKQMILMRKKQTKYFENLQRIKAYQKSGGDCSRNQKIADALGYSRQHIREVIKWGVLHGFLVVNERSFVFKGLN